jgi:hypothetical protein
MTFYGPAGTALSLWRRDSLTAGEGRCSGKRRNDARAACGPLSLDALDVYGGILVLLSR